MRTKPRTPRRSIVAIRHAGQDERATLERLGAALGYVVTYTETGDLVFARPGLRAPGRGRG